MPIKNWILNLESSLIVWLSWPQRDAAHLPWCGCHDHKGMQHISHGVVVMNTKGMQHISHGVVVMNTKGCSTSPMVWLSWPQRDAAHLPWCGCHDHKWMQYISHGVVVMNTKWMQHISRGVVVMTAKGCSTSPMAWLSWTPRVAVQDKDSL